MKKIISFLTVLIVIMLVGCATTSTTDTFRFQVSELKLNVGETKKLDLIMGDFSKSEEIVAEQVDKQAESGSVRVISAANGVIEIEATKVGEVRFQAYIKNKTNVKDTITITIENPKVNMIKIGSDSEDPATGKIEVYIDETVTLKVTSTPEIANAEFVYVSGNETIAKVDSNGVVTGMNKGVTKIYAYEKNDPSFKAEKEITVKYVDTAKIETDKEQYTLIAGETLQIKAVAYDKNGETHGVEQTFRYTSNNTRLKISKEGVVTCEKNGTYTVTILGGSIRKSVKVIVEYPTEIKTDTITINKTTAKVIFSNIFYVQNLTGELVEESNIITIDGAKTGFTINGIGTCKVRLTSGEYTKVVTIVIVE